MGIFYDNPFYIFFKCSLKIYFIIFHKITRDHITINERSNNYYLDDVKTYLNKISHFSLTIKKDH